MKSIALLAAAIAVIATVASASAAVRATAPVNATAPTIAGPLYVGKTLTTTHGAWQNGPTTFSYQWVRCDANGNGCTQISGATSKTYTPTSADVNHTLESWVTATNSAGTTGPVASHATGNVITPALPPTNTTAPTVVGQPLVDATLFANVGKYSGGAVARYFYQWERCAKAALTCNSVSGATNQTYKVTSDDLDQRLRVQVTARNPFGKITTASAPTAPIQAAKVTVTTSLTATTPATVCCSSVRLSGTTNPAKAGETVTILAREVDNAVAASLVTARTDANGNWSVFVTPKIQTVYTAQTTTSTSPAKWLYVHPRVGFGRSGHTFTAKITGRDSFAGSIAWVQMRTNKGTWRRIASVVINQYSVARFHVNLRRHQTYYLRIYLPKSQAGLGYLDGLSMTKKVRF